MSETLAAFLTARLNDDEDERLARAADDYVDWFNPVRALRDVRAKRKILALHDPEGIGRTCRACTEPNLFPCSTLRHLAAIYSDHPDYDPDWAV